LEGLLYPWRRIDPVPWAPLSAPLSRCTVALVSTAGFVAPGQPPFDLTKRGGDTSFRVIPAETDLRGLVEWQRSEAFDHTGIRQDPTSRFRSTGFERSPRAGGSVQ
jgi:D-proline reductase (dithiol) PrdB